MKVSKIVSFSAAALCLALTPLALSASAAHAQFTNIDDPDAAYGTYPRGIADNVIFGFFGGVDGSHGFLYDGSTYATFDYPGHETIVQGVSGDIIVGDYYTLIEGDGDSYFQEHGFVYNKATDTFSTPPDLGVSPSVILGLDGDKAVGFYGGSNNSIGFVYDVTTGAYTNTDINVPGATGTIASDISGNKIVGSFTSAPNQYSLFGIHGYLFDGSTYTTLDDPLASYFTDATGIDGNKVVGFYYNATGAHGFTFDGSTYTTIDHPQAYSTIALGIEGNKVVGYYYDEDYNEHGFLHVAAVPEPGVVTFGVLAAGSVLGLVARKRKA